MQRERRDNNQEQEKEARQFRKNISVNSFMSIPFTSMNFYETAYFAIYMIITIGLFVYKVQKYPFPQYAVSMQSVLLTFFALSHYMRYQIAKIAISQKLAIKFVHFIVVTIFLIPLYVFQLRLQTYVLLVEFVMNWLGIALAIVQMIAAIWVLVIEKKKNSS